MIPSSLPTVDQFSISIHLFQKRWINLQVRVLRLKRGLTRGICSSTSWNFYSCSYIALSLITTLVLYTLMQELVINYRFLYFILYYFWLVSNNVLQQYNAYPYTSLIGKTLTSCLSLRGQCTFNGHVYALCSNRQEHAQCMVLVLWYASNMKKKIMYNYKAVKK